MAISKRRGAAIGAAGVILATVAAGCGGSSHASTTAPPPARSNVAVTAAPTTSTTLEQAKPYDPTKPIDLGGTPGVTPAEQHRAETLLRNTIVGLAKYDDVDAAYAAGYRSIGDSITGDEHYVKWAYVDDGHILDPQRPESLVYEMRDNHKTLVAAMYMLPFGSRFTDVPDVGGALTQWHVHRDLCLTNDPMQKVLAGFTFDGGTCPAGTTKAGNTPMLHVWVVPNRCGPFAALEGVGGGQIPDGQTRLCDTAHGDPSA
jgi:hypothetical protein